VFVCFYRLNVLPCLRFRPHVCIVVYRGRLVAFIDVHETTEHNNNNNNNIDVDTVRSSSSLKTDTSGTNTACLVQVSIRPTTTTLLLPKDTSKTVKVGFNMYVKYTVHVHVSACVRAASSSSVVGGGAIRLIGRLIMAPNEEPFDVHLPLVCRDHGGSIKSNHVSKQAAERVKV